MGEPQLPMCDPCAFSARPRQAVLTARHYVSMFPAGAVVLDIGFGQGTFLQEARAAGLRVVGVDRDANLVADAKSRGFEAIACDVKDLGEHLTAPVDGVMVAHLIEHLSPTDLAQLFRDIAKLVRPGGVAILATPNFKDWRVASEWFWLDPTHVRPYPPGAIQQIINPDDWTWDKWDYEQISVTRELPVVWVKRLVFGWDYGRSGVWYRLTRNPCHAST